MKNRKRNSTSIFSLVIVLLLVVVYQVGSSAIEKKMETKKTENHTKVESTSLENAPEYYRVLGSAEITSKTDGIAYKYDEEKNKPLSVHAKITSEIFEREKSEKREPIKVDPVGWGHNSKVVIPSTIGSIKDYKGYFWNRSHLLADSLGGEPTKKNLITGTRCQNVGLRNNQGGMAYCENKARKYLSSHKNSYIYYNVDCVYTNDELIPRKVIVNILSEDKSINEKVEVLNCANGFEINYNTGEFTKEN